jgi:hypothetical protein
MEAFAHGVLALLAALVGCVVVGKWVYKSHRKDATIGGRVAAGVVLVLLFGVIVVIAIAVISSHSSGS